MGAQRPEELFSRAGLGTVVRPPPNPDTLAADDHLKLRPVEVAEGLSHHGEPADEEEVIVVEEPERPSANEPKVVRAPRVPTQEERNAHEAMHIPHEGWCELCVWRAVAATRPTERIRDLQGRRPTSIALVHPRRKANP